jgi:hypothetical protein
MIKNPSKYKSNSDIEKLYISAPSGLATALVPSIGITDSVLNSTLNEMVQNSGYTVNDDNSVTVTIGGRK